VNGGEDADPEGHGGPVGAEADARLAAAVEAVADGTQRIDHGAERPGLDIGAGNIATTVRFGEMDQEILGFADRIAADLILLESHKPGVADYLLGSNAARVVRHAACSVFLLR
jgi:nucleotide-binding universal stress UspA family protein